MALRIKLLRTSGKIPTVGHPGEDLGYDLYSDGSFIIPPHEVVMVTTGIAMEFQPKAGGLILTRSSMAKKGIIVVGGVVDAGYRGEILVMLANIGKTEYYIAPGDKIAQLVQFPFIAGEASPVSDLSAAIRDKMGWGSTGK